VLARTTQGAARVKLQVEWKLVGTAFNGSTNLKTSTAWTQTTVPATNLVVTVTGLTAAKNYHWRARLLYEPAAGLATQRSRWYYASTDINGVHVRTP
jgi:hypothetical protein